MSVKAVNWAFQQDVGEDPYKRCVLLALADSADDNGFTYAKQKDIAKKAAQSVRSVFRKLTELAEMGLVRIEPDLDPHTGRRRQNNHWLLMPGCAPPDRESDGRKPSPEAESDQEFAEGDLPPSDRESGGAETEPPDRESDGVPDSESDDDRESGGYRTLESGGYRTLESEQSTIINNRQNLSLSQEPHARPDEGERESSIDEAKRRFDRFVEGYRFDATMSRALAWEAFRRLTVGEQTLAARHAKDYRAALKERGKKYAIDPDRWLATKGFRDVAAAQESETKAATSIGAVPVRAGSPEWTALTVFYRLVGDEDIPSFLVTGHGSDRVAIALSPARLALGRGLDPDKHTWVPVAQGSREYAAWMARLREAAPDQRIHLCTVKVDGREQLGLYVPPTPTGFPPARTSQAEASPSTGDVAQTDRDDDMVADPRLEMGSG